MHWDVEVETFDNDAKYTVCQIYVSACPVGYGKTILPKDWEPLSTIALNSLYEVREDKNGRLPIMFILLSIFGWEVQ